MLASLFRRRKLPDEALALYAAAVGQARQEDFYRHLGVPDSLDGRFELIALHVWLLCRRLRGEGPAAEQIAQDLVEVFFADMDVSLREIGAADIGVGRRVKRMIEAFHGRAAAYDKALKGGEESLGVALARNLYGTVKADSDHLAAIEAYIAASGELLRTQPIDALLRGEALFPPAGTT